MHKNNKSGMLELNIVFRIYHLFRTESRKQLAYLVGFKFLNTSIQGMTAKPVIDIMFGVSSLQESKSAIPKLVKNNLL